MVSLIFNFYLLLLFTSLLLFFYFLFMIYKKYLWFMIYYLPFKFLPWELDPFQYVRTSLIFRFDAPWELGRFSLSGFHFQWKLALWFSWWLSLLVLASWFSLKTRLKLNVGFQLVGENCHTLVQMAIMNQHPSTHHERWMVNG